MVGMPFCGRLRRVNTGVAGELATSEPSIHKGKAQFRQLQFGSMRENGRPKQCRQFVAN
jgi:hypothetical protein